LGLLTASISLFCFDLAGEFYRSVSSSMLNCDIACIAECWDFLY